MKKQCSKQNERVAILCNACGVSGPSGEGAQPRSALSFYDHD